MKIIVTGASGVLGRALTKALHSKGHVVLPLSFSRTSSLAGLPPYIPLDLLSTVSVLEFFNSEQVKGTNWVIHCAAERRVDEAGKDQDKTVKLNVDVVGLLASECVRIGCGMIYISTEYVFDGTKPPYTPDDAPNPLNFYGITKLNGEKAILNVRSAQKPPPSLSVLRVPLLYGEVEYNSESAANVLVDVVINSSKPVSMDDFAPRYPTSTTSLSRIISHLTSVPTASLPLPPVIHYSSQVPYTKYEQCQIIARALEVEMGHIRPDKTDLSKLPPPAVKRPGNTKLSVVELIELLGEDKVVEAEEEGGFEGWWKDWARRNPIKRA